MFAIQCHVLYLFVNGTEVKLPNWEPIATILLSRRDQYDEMYCVTIMVSCILFLDTFYRIYFTPFAELVRI